MTLRDSSSPAPAGPTRLRFDRYVLDLDRGCLRLGVDEIPLRPKTFAVLHYLIANSSRLVSKDELFAAVWPNLTVTDDALVQSIGELRRALGDDGPRLIKTIPRRGYRFESDVSAVVAPLGPSPDHATSSSAASNAAAQAPEGAAAPRASSEAARTGSRPGRPAWVMLAVVIVAAVGLIWSGLASRGKLPNPSRQADPATKTAEIATRPAIAILPLLSQSDDSARAYFADGLTQDIINALGRFSGLTVMSWNAVFPYRGKSTSPAEIARSLAVRYEVEGSVRQNGDRVQVIAQLVDTDGRVLWSGRFDEALADVFALQEKITAQIAGTLAIQVTQIEQRRAFAKPTESLKAYDCVLRARPALQHPTRATIVEARALLRRAIRLDPNYAAAYAALAETYYLNVSMGWAESPAEFLTGAQELANKALSIDDSDVRARVILGRIDIFYHRYGEAKAEMDRAVETNPNDADGLAGRGNALMWMGQTDAAIAAFEAAQRIDPELNPLDRFALSLAYYLKRRYDASIEQAELNLDQTAGANFSRVVLAAAYAEENRTEDAVRVVTLIHRSDPTFDPHGFGSKFLNPADLDHLRDGFRKAGLYTADAASSGGK